MKKKDAIVSICWEKVKELGLTVTEAEQVVSNLKEFFGFTDAQAEFAEFILDKLDKDIKEKDNESRSK